MTWKELLFVVAEMPEPFRKTEVAEQVGLPRTQINGRLAKLQKWGYIRYVNRKLKARGGLIVTEWGRKMTAKWLAEQPKGEEHGEREQA